MSLLDIVPTILDWFQIDYPKYKLLKKPVTLTGHSVLPLLGNSFTRRKPHAIFASHSLHEVTMYYPMRSVRTDQYKLIRNLNYKMPFPIDQDFYISSTFQDLLNRTKYKKETHWSKTLQQYYYRDQWELYDLHNDPTELTNLASQSRFRFVFDSLKRLLHKWQNITNDPWICGPGAVLEDRGPYKFNPQCMGLNNDLH